MPWLLKTAGFGSDLVEDLLYGILESHTSPIVTGHADSF